MSEPHDFVATDPSTWEHTALRDGREFRTRVVVRRGQHRTFLRVSVCQTRTPPGSWSTPYVMIERSETSRREALIEIDQLGELVLALTQAVDLVARMDGVASRIAKRARRTIRGED